MIWVQSTPSEGWTKGLRCRFDDDSDYMIWVQPTPSLVSDHAVAPYWMKRFTMIISAL